MSGPAPVGERRTRCDPDPFPDTNLVDLLLTAQQELQTPVAHFSRTHETGSFPDRQNLYRHLIPLEKPGRDEQYAFQVELDRCTGCKACVTACHSLNGLDDDEAWREVGTLIGGADDPGWQQTVTTACHHCQSPECLHGCPVGAYDKDDETGIVRHLDDQCIGCEYCIMKCPYEAPKYSKSRGIVRKCDMCHQRLANGEAPACAQACPTEAIRIVTMDARQTTPSFLPGTPNPEITRPTTVFTGREIPPTAGAIDRDTLVLQPAHWPLVFMLVLTQAGLGVLSAGLWSHSLAHAAIGSLLFFAGLISSITHLGRPLGAWRFFLGLRRSWLSREILAFGMIAAAIVPLMGSLLVTSPPPIITAAFTTLAGIGILTSTMVYVDTCRPGWDFVRTGTRFYGTSLAAACAAFALTNATTPFWFTLILAGKLTFEALALLHLFDRRWSSLRQSARLQTGPLKRITITRFAMGIGAIGLAQFSLPHAFLFFLLGEIAERLLFFRSVAPLRMPGALASSV